MKESGNDERKSISTTRSGGRRSCRAALVLSILRGKTSAPEAREVSRPDPGRGGGLEGQVCSYLRYLPATRITKLSFMMDGRGLGCRAWGLGRARTAPWKVDVVRLGVDGHGPEAPRWVRDRLHHGELSGEDSRATVRSPRR